MSKQLTTDKKFASELNGKDLGVYEFVYDLLTKIERKTNSIDEKDTFHYLMENSKDGKLPKMPSIKYTPDLEGIPRNLPNELIACIASLLKNDIRLPKSLMDYLVHALESVAKNNCDISNEFLFNSIVRKYEKGYENVLKKVIDYIFTRFSILYTLGKKKEDILSFKNKSGADFYEEITEEIHFKFNVGNYGEQGAINDYHFDFSMRNIKKLIIDNKIFNTCKFWNPDFIPSNSPNNEDNIEDYKLYLKTRMQREYDMYPLRKKEAIRRLKELDLLEQFLRISPSELSEDKTFGYWFKTQSSSLFK